MSFHPSVCPHDCPSVCALDVERLPDGRLGKVRGSERNPFTAGVICAKVARYQERYHHPERLGFPLQRTGAKGSGDFRRIGWDDALDEIAANLLRVERRHGAEAVWPYWYAGTMGLVQRDGIERLTHVKKYSRFKSTICVMLSDTGFKAGHGLRWGVPATEIAEHSDLVVVWGTNPVHTHVNMMTHIARARKERGAKLVVVDPYRSATAELADHAPGLAAGHRRCPGLRRHARPVQGGHGRPRLSRPLQRRARRAGAAPARPYPRLGLGHHRPGRGRDPGLRPALRGHQARVPAPRLRLHPLAQRGGRHARRLLPAGRDRRLAASGGRGALQFRRALPLGQDDDRGPGRPRSCRPRARPVAHRPHPGGRARGTGGRRPGPCAADPEHQPDVHRPRARQGASRLRPRRPVRGGARAVPDRHGGRGRHRPAGHHVPRACRHLPGGRPPHDPGAQADPGAVRGVPDQPFRHLASWRDAWARSIRASP